MANNQTRMVVMFIPASPSGLGPGGDALIARPDLENPGGSRDNFCIVFSTKSGVTAEKVVLIS